jgi:hypothetical protein
MADLASKPAAEYVLSNHPMVMRDALGSHYELGDVFSKAIGNPTVMRSAARHRVPHTTLMKLVL